MKKVFLVFLLLFSSSVFACCCKNKSHYKKSGEKCLFQDIVVQEKLPKTKKIEQVEKEARVFIEKGEKLGNDLNEDKVISAIKKVIKEEQMKKDVNPLTNKHDTKYENKKIDKKTLMEFADEQY